MAIAILIQIASVPIYLRGFGTTVYGEWLVLSTIPLYLSISDLGFASVSANQATRQATVGDLARARETMRSAWLMVSLLSASLFAVAGLLVPFVPFGFLPVRAIPTADQRWILLLLIGYALATLQSSFVEGCFRAGGRFPVGIIMANLLRLAEFVAAASVALSTRNPVVVAAALFGTRTIGQAAYALALKRLVPELALGFRAAHPARLRELVVPALAFLSFPLGNALAVQGMVMVTAAKLGASAVVTLNALRVMANLLRHISSVVYNGVLPEVTAAVALEDRDRARRLVNTSFAATLLVAGLCFVVLAAAGDIMLAIWTGGRVQASSVLIVAMLATVLADLPWLAWSLLLLARNEHQLIGALYAGSCLLAVLAAEFLLPRIGLLAVPLSLLLIDVIVYVPAYRGSIRSLRLIPTTDEHAVTERGPGVAGLGR